MKVAFYDQQNDFNPMNGKTICNNSELLETLDNLTHRQPFFAELAAENRCTLLIGIGGTIGCVQYSGPDGNPPYMMALGTTKDQNQGYVEFLTADTGTPVPKRYCIALDQVKNAASYFFETGNRTPELTWEEI